MIIFKSKDVQAYMHINQRGDNDMAERKRDLSAWERSEYEVISETETETEKTVVLRLKHGGAAVVCRIPKLSPEGERERVGRVTRALTEFAHPDEDISTVKKIEIIT